jgi:hypothetical protein
MYWIGFVGVAVVGIVAKVRAEERQELYKPLEQVITQ